MTATAQLCSEHTCEWKCPGHLNALGIMDAKEAEIPGDWKRQRRKHKGNEHEKKGRRNNHSAHNLFANNHRNTLIFLGLDWGSQSAVVHRRA